MKGKIVECQVPSRDEKGRRNGGYQVIIGVCTHLGPNQHLNEPIWAVVDRMPVSLNSLDQINEVKPK